MCLGAGAFSMIVTAVVMSCEVAETLVDRQSEEAALRRCMAGGADLSCDTLCRRVCPSVVDCVVA